MAKKKVSLKGVVIALVGAFLIYWAQTHSPKAGVGNMIKNEIAGSYTLTENWYYGTMILGIAALVFGIYTIYKDMK